MNARIPTTSTALIAGLAFACSLAGCAPFEDDTEPAGPDAGARLDAEPPAPPGACESGNASSVDETGVCYSLFAIPTHWDEARELCAAWGSDTRLVTLETQAEWDAVSSLVEPYPDFQFWIGASAAAPEVATDLSGPWRWVTGAPMEYDDWAVKEPNQTHVRACAYVQNREGRFRWKEDPCDEDRLFSFVCETDPAP